MLINKRPIAFKSSLNKLDTDVSALNAITPEMIITGRDIPCINILPPLGSDDMDEDFILNENRKVVLERSKQLSKVRSKLNELYQNEFVANLFHQSTDRKSRYTNQNHIELKSGDIVSVKTPNIKPFHFPLAIVVDVEINDLDEVVAASVRKANGEVVRRHVTDLVFLTGSDHIPDEDKFQLVIDTPVVIPRPVRQAAVKCTAKNRQLLSDP